MVAEYLKSQLRKIGLDVRLHASPDWSSWAERVSNGTHDMTLAITFSWGDPVIGTHRSYMSDNIRKGVAYSNMSGYRNARSTSCWNGPVRNGPGEARRAL